VVVQEAADAAVVAALDPADNVEPSESSDEVVALAREALGRVLAIVRAG
jgi:hypothetical protein